MRSIVPVLSRLFGLLLLGTAACETSSPSSVTVTDSAGVRITLSSAGPKTFAEVDAEPLLTLGGSQTAGPEQFYRIRSVVVGPRGRLWVADGQSAEIRIFGSDGAHWKTLGGRGEGPGEFLDLRLLGLFRGDSVAAWDSNTGRLTVFDADGALARTQRIPPGEDPPLRGVAVFEDGSMLAQVPRIVRAESVEAGQILGDSARLVRVDFHDSTRVFMAAASGPRWLWTGRSQVPIPFTINAAFDVWGETVHLVAGPEFRVRVFQRGRVSAIYGIAREPREVAQSDRDAFRATAQEYIPEPTRTDYLSALRRPEVPEVLPAYSALVVSADGQVWCQLYAPEVNSPGTWDVFGADGEWLGQVQTPAGFTLMSIDPPGLTGVWRDELAVEYVRVYRYRRG